MSVTLSQAVNHNEGFWSPKLSRHCSRTHSLGYSAIASVHAPVRAGREPPAVTGSLPPPKPQQGQPQTEQLKRSHEGVGGNTRILHSTAKATGDLSTAALSTGQLLLTPHESSALMSAVGPRGAAPPSMQVCFAHPARSPTPRLSTLVWKAARPRFRADAQRVVGTPCRAGAHRGGRDGRDAGSSL